MPDGNADERYDVILTGRLAQGRELEAVVAAIASRYQIDEERVRRLLSKAPRTWKSSPSRARAERHAKALRDAGAMAIVAKHKDSAAEPGTEFYIDTVLLPDAAPANNQSPAQISASPSPTSPQSESAQESATADAQGRPPEHAPDADSARPAASALPSAEISLDPAPTPPAPVSSRKGALRWGTSGLILGFSLGIATGWWAAPLFGPGPRATANPEPSPPPVSSAALGAPSDASDPGDPHVRSASPPASPTAPEETAVAVTSDQADSSAPRVTGAATSGTMGAATRADGPMGLAQGSPASALDLADGDDSQGELGPGLKRLASVPRPLPGFRRFAAMVTDDAGLCGIEAESDPVATSDDGSALQDAFSGIEAMLDRDYGSIHRTSIRLSRNTDAQDASWMQQLMDGDRRLTSVWSAVAEDGLPDGLQRIRLSAIATTDTSGALKVEYRFNNFDDCTR